VDLGIVAAVTSSFRNIPINEKTIVFGEVGLAGEVRATNHAAARLPKISDRENNLLTTNTQA
jgi:DNA repair protein RadA/Sms